jgi:hypothetical protein
MQSTIARYRCPRERDGQPSRVLVLYQEGLTFTMTGGKYGTHTVTATEGDDRVQAQRRVAAHWAGYVAATMGRTVQTQFPHFLALVPRGVRA